MRTRILATLLLLCFFAPQTALADGLAASLSDIELAASVTGVSILLTAKSSAQGNRAMLSSTDGSRYQGFTGIQTISTNSGTGSVSQAATSLSVRAMLSLGQPPGPRI
jgi:hypothetical protein